MRRMWPAIVLGVCLFWACSAVRAQGEFPLERHEIKDFDQSPYQSLLSMGYKAASGDSEKPPNLKALPKDVTGNVTYFLVTLGGTEFVFLADSAPPPRLYADTDGDGDLSDETPVPTGDQEQLALGWQTQTVVLGPVTLKAPGGKSVQVYIRPTVFRDLRRLGIYAGGLRTGEVRLGGRSYQVAVVDGDYDGRYDGTVSLPLDFSEGPVVDILGIDLNDNRKFELTLDPPLFEALPLPRMVSVEGAYYSVDVAADGSAIRLKEVEPAFGTLDAGSADVEAVFLSENGFHLLSEGEGKWRLPVGKYTPLQVTLKKTDDSGSTWKLSGQFDPTELPCLEIGPGETQTLEVGPPLSAQTDVSPMGESVSIRFSLVGRGKETYAPGAMKDGQRNPAPKFEIADESGKVVLSDAFQYG